MTTSTVEEKIHIEKRLPFNPNNKTGPTIDLYFHELNSEKTMGQKILRTIGGLFLGIVFLLSLPLIALGIKLLSGEPIFRKVTVPGRRGIVFQQYLFPITQSQSNKPFAFGSFLKSTGLYKLPSVINIWKGEMNLVGPRAYPSDWSNHWNRKLSDYYKRYALNPGYIPVGDPITNSDNISQVEDSLDEELKYILNPSLTKDVKYILGID